jgi:porphyrinogen peroxidase
MPAPEPQAVLTRLTEAAIFLTLTVEAGAEDVTRDLLADVSGLRRSVGFRIPEAELSCVVGVGSALWDRLFGAPRPAELHPFRALAGARHAAPATPGDLHFHLRAHRLDLCFELARQVTIRLAGHAQVVDEVHGFRSFDERDLLGFVDGTETRRETPRAPLSWSATRTRRSRAGATSPSRSTSTTSTPGTRSPSRSRSGRSAGRS